MSNPYVPLFLKFTVGEQRIMRKALEQYRPSLVGLNHDEGIRRALLDALDELKPLPTMAQAFGFEPMP